MKLTLHPSRLLKRFSRSPVPGPQSPAFTVVELSVVLVVLGVILTGVLKLEQVYRNYKIRQVVNQYRELSAAIKVYRDKYGYWPGDDPRANVHLNDVSIQNGNGDDFIDWLSPTWEEYLLVLKHLSRAGLLAGNYNAITLTSGYMTHSFGNAVWFSTNNIQGIGRKNVISFRLLPSDVAAALDVAMDDGINNTGTIRAYDYATGNYVPYTGTVITTSMTLD